LHEARPLLPAPVRDRSPRLLASIGMCATALLLGAHGHGQVRGVYPLGMSATGSGFAPAVGVTYTNMFLFYSRDRLTDGNGNTTMTGQNSVLMDLSTIAWGSKRDILRGARFAFAATLPIANNSLSADTVGAISGGGGFADSFYQPVMLGWEHDRAKIRFAYGFLAPTGRFHAGASDNVGSGYWTHVLSSGQTFVLGDTGWTASAFQMYEWHGTQSGTGVRPGDTLNLDYSFMRAIPVREGLDLQVGLVGYSQRQMTDKAGPTITPEEAGDRYRVDALGVASTLTWRDRRIGLGLKYFDEVESRFTFEGYSVQISASVGF
jgi:hypothetical protein